METFIPCRMLLPISERRNAAIAHRQFWSRRRLCWTGILTPAAIRSAKRFPEICAGARAIFRFSRPSKPRCSKSRTKGNLQRRFQGDGRDRHSGGRMPDEKDSRKIPVDAPKTNGDELRVIGVPRRRVDARAKVTGQTRFADDIFLPRMAHCKLLRSPHPHARIRKIDTSRAAAHPGVYLVLTGKDVPIQYGILPVSQDEQALCVDRVRHVGDPVAAVIAREELTAFEALDFSNVEEGFAEADEIFEDTFFFQGNTHLPIEQHAAVAIKDPEGKLTIWSSTQTPHYVHRALAKV